MLDAYGVIGVAVGADRAEIRAAYIKLAKQLHPDRTAGDAEAQRRLQEVNQAYELLKDPDKRSAYDLRFNASRKEKQRRWRQTAAVMAASFVLTAALASTLLFAGLFPQRDDVVQAAPSSKADQPAGRAPLAANAIVFATLAAAPPEPPDVTADPGMAAHIDPVPAWHEPAPEPAGQQLAMLQEPEQDRAVAPAETALRQHAWVTYRNDRFGFSLDYPADVFTSPDRAHDDFWRLLVSRDGRARLLVTAGFNAKGATSASYRQALLSEAYGDASLEYTPLRKTWFVLAGRKAEESFYERATLACDGRTIHGWRLTYPPGERAFYSQIIDRMHQGYKHARGAGRHCG